MSGAGGETAAALEPLVAAGTAASDPAAVALMIAVAALQREESRGAYHRTDVPRHAAVAWRSRLRLDDALASARALAAPLVPLARKA